VGEPYRAALARRRQAEALLEAGSDRPAAQQVIGQAWSAARRIGAAHLRAELEDLARRARIRLPDDSRATPAAMSPFRLTPREQEVLRLVSQGLADRQIGMSLFISHRTVERHVSNLLSKLGVTRRAELVALAHQDAVLTARVDLGEVGP
jgi:DNA-binding NarL/FixJ family response regulator